MTAMEIEFKYRADDISLTAFKAFCASIKAIPKIINASGYDHFYSNTTDADRFGRLRSGADMHQLTFKRKTTDKNNYIRTEHNIDLLPTVTKEQIEALFSEFGYNYNMSLFKTCFIYQYDWYTFVYYICYDSDMKELGRFFEIEMNESHSWSSQEEAWNQLQVMERLCRPLGVTPQSRVKRSLFELFKKEAPCTITK